MEVLSSALSKFGSQMEEKEKKYLDMKINYEKT